MPLSPHTRSILASWGYSFLYDDSRCLPNRVYAI